MSLTGSKLFADRPQLPRELHASQVKALFSDPKSYLIGATGACVALGLTWFRVGAGALLVLFLALITVVLSRCSLMRLFHRAKDGRPPGADLSRWEVLYHVGATLQITIIGTYCFTTFACTDAVVDRLLSMATVLAYMAGIPGRNFANAAGVNAQILGGGIPLILAMASAGQQYLAIAGVVLLPFFTALRGLSNRLRGIFVEATVKAYELNLLANRFDTALNNMPHGLAMFDAEGRLAVHNTRFGELLSLDPGLGRTGTSAAAVAQDLRRCAGLRESDLRQLAAAMTSLSSSAIEVEKRGGVSLDVTLRSMPTGGAVMVVQDVTERRRAVARINQLALYDELTGVLNRTHFRTLANDLLSQAAPEEAHALLFLDLDHFKRVNDSLGHTRGDKLIREVASRLREHVDATSILGRFGGDEFMILRRHHGGVADVEAASTLIAHLSKPYLVDGHEIVIGASVGVARFPDDGSSIDELLRRADLALYRSKANGRGTCRVFEEAMDEQERLKGQIGQELYRALREGEFEVHYQPILDVRTQRFRNCEALLRWRHPARGLVPPAEFIPVAEETGFIVEIGKFVLERACEDCAGWPDGIGVAVNISPLQFRHRDLLATVVSAMRKARLAASRLTLELTESVLLQDPNHASLTMGLLRAHNVNLALDDFGTGFSSLSYLNRLPLGKVKIDRSFLADLDGDERVILMLRGLIRLIFELGLQSVVEGVETVEQLRKIETCTGVGEIQGFLFSRPLPNDQIAPFLAGAHPIASPVRLAG